jgi:hypothetical protein
VFEQEFIQRILTAEKPQLRAGRLESVDRRFQQRSRSGRSHSPSVALPNGNGRQTGVLS